MKNYINKFINSLKKNGIINTFKKVYRVIKHRIIIKYRKNNKVVNKYINLNNFENIIIFENNFGWNKIMKQRPQQIAESFDNNTLFIYHSHEDVDFKRCKDRINKLKDNLYLVDLGYYREDLLSLLRNYYNKYLMVYSTDYIPFDRIKLYKDNGFELIYEYVDDFNPDLSGLDIYKSLVKRHKKILELDPFVVCTASKLYDNCVNDGFKYLSLISNGVDYNHFKVDNFVVPDDMVTIKEKHKNIICYYGALASWLDYELIKKLSKNKDYGIVLLGQDYDMTLEKSKVLDCDNVYYLGKKKYEELPSYGYSSDLFIIPFLINDITKATSPVKIFEYMAMGKPIITTALPECKKYKSVFYSNNHDEFIRNIEKALKVTNDKKYLKILDDEAKTNTWESKASSIIKFIKEASLEKDKNYLKNIIKNNKYERIVIWRSPFGWNVPLFQRPQHIAREFAKQKCLVFYEITNKTDIVSKINNIEDNLYLVNFENTSYREIFDSIINKVMCPKYVQIYSTNWTMDLDELNTYEKNGFKVLYEYIDDLSPELAGTLEIPKFIMDKYNYALNNKDVLIVTTANALYSDVKKKRGKDNLILSCNGVNYDFFQRVDRNYKFENEFLSIIKNGKTNLCYYGALAKWFDYDLIRRINDTNEYNIILFGIKYDDAYDNSGINDLKNVYFLGSKDYHILKNYASKMDILMIPFVINSITKATSPLKLFEYMALHKPIVTTAMDECMNYKSVLVANNHDEFIDNLHKAIKLKNDKKYLSLLEKEGKDNDWSKKAELIIDLFKENEVNENGKN